MLAQLKRLAGDSFLYALMSVSTKLIAFVMFPIYTHYLLPSEYGVLGIIDGTVAILSYFVIFGTDTALAFYYFEEKDQDKKLQYVQNVMAFRLLVALVITVIVLLAGNNLVPWLNIGSSLMPFFYLSLMTLVLDSINILALTVYRYEMRTLRVVLLTVAKMLFIAILSYILLIYWSESIGSIIWGRIISITIVILLSGRQMLKYLRLRFDKDIWMKVLKYGAPLVPASLSFWVMGTSNRYIIATMDSTTSVGIYVAAFQFATMISLLTYGIQMAWRPYSMQMKDHPDGKVFFSKAYTIIFTVGMVGIVAVTSVMPLVILMLDPKYQASYQYVGFLSLASFLNFFYIIVSSGLLFAKKTKSISGILVLAALLNIALNIVMYIPFGLWGIVISNVIAYLLTCILVFFQSQKYYHVPIQTGKMLFLFIQSVITISAMVYLQVHDFAGWYQIFPWLYFIATLAICRIDLVFKGLKTK
ncbi:lipopolysaccharide biosynthesis protein [Shimazuella kribbensis]|uniref:lipopolysaccharide biosynthesis protein n=1 Tax=Shimazuella kribbensis TaxID=139808 RepID=UPI000404E013|nr:oligosaccharide flippase family protein [Shimazuella kribbensis]